MWSSSPLGVLASAPSGYNFANSGNPRPVLFVYSSGRFKNGAGNIYFAITQHPPRPNKLLVNMGEAVNAPVAQWQSGVLITLGLLVQFQSGVYKLVRLLTTKHVALGATGSTKPNIPFNNYDSV